MNGTQSVTSSLSVASSPPSSPRTLPASSPPPWPASASFPPARVPMLSPINLALNPRRRKRVDSRIKSAGSKKRRNTDSMSNVKLKQMFDLMESFSWTIEDFLVAVLDEAATTEYAVTRVPAYTRRRFLRYAYEKIPDDNDVFEFLNDNISEPLRKWAMDIVLKSANRELERLTKLPKFGKYKAETVTATELDQTLTEPVSQIIDVAPTLFSLLDGCTSKSWKTKSLCDMAQDEVLDKTKNLQFLVTTMCHLRHPIGSTNLPVKLSMYLYGAGLGRRGLDLLSKYSICSSYRTMSSKIDNLQEKALQDMRKLGAKPTSIVTYDNFEFRDGKRGERIGDQAQFRSITTALVIPDRLGYTQPLARTMWRPQTYQLDVIDIMQQFAKSPMDKEIALYHIQSSIKSITEDERIKWPIKDPCIQRLPPCKTQAKPLSPIMKDENSNENNISILENIYRVQLGMEENNHTFFHHLRVTSGDQKTWARMVSAQAIRAIRSEKRADSLSWNLPILGLWHYRYNLLGMIHSTHWGAPTMKKLTDNPTQKHQSGRQDNDEDAAFETDVNGVKNSAGQKAQMDASSLQFAADRWNRAGVLDGTDFQATEQLIIDSYHSRVVAVLLHQLNWSGKPMADTQDLSEWLSSLDTESFRTVLELILEDLSASGSTEEAQDQVYLNHKHFCANVQVYLTLKYAIKYADIGLLRYILPHTTAMFHDKQGHKPNYANASLYMLHLLCSRASDKKLQDFVLANSLVNMQGRENSNFELDRLLELHNGLLRRFINERTCFSNGDADDMLRRWATIGPLLDGLKNSFHMALGMRIDGTHPVKRASDDIFSLALRLQKNAEMCQQTTPRNSDFPAPNLVLSGQQVLFSGDTVFAYNCKYEYVEEAALEDEQMAEDTAEIDEPTLLLDADQTIQDYDFDVE